MTQENKDRLLRLLQQHKELGISDQIDFDKFYLDSIISNSVSLVNNDYGTDIDQFIRSTSDEGGQKTEKVDRKGGQKNSVAREQRKHAFILPSGRVLSKTRDAILNMINRNAKVTSTQMAASLGINRSAVSKHLKKLQADGIIRRVGPDKGGHWEIIEADK